MTKDELIASLKDELQTVKGDLEQERKAHAETRSIFEQAKSAVGTLEATLRERDNQIAELAALPGTAVHTGLTVGVEFKHDGKLYRLNEPADRKLIIPSFGEMTAAEAVLNEEVAAYLVQTEQAEEIN